MKSLVKRSAADGISVCKRTLMGENQAAVRKFLGVSDLNHGEEEFTYHPLRKDGSMWILLISFVDDQVSDINGYELSPRQKKPNHTTEPTSTSRGDSL